MTDEDGDAAGEVAWHETRWLVAGKVIGKDANTPEKRYDWMPELEREENETASGDRREVKWEKMAAMVKQVQMVKVSTVDLLINPTQA